MGHSNKDMARNKGIPCGRAWFKFRFHFPSSFLLMGTLGCSK